MRPTAQYDQHHDTAPPKVDASSFRQGWVVHTRLDGLLDDQLITPGQWQAACTYRGAWDRTLALPGAWAAFAGSRSPGGTGDPHSHLTALVGLQALLRRVEEGMGPQHTALCRLCVVEDRSWRSIGGLLHVSHHTARRRAAVAVAALAKWVEDG